MPNRKEDYDTICKRIQELINLFENECTLSTEQLNDIVNRITKLNKILEQLKK